MLLLPMTLINCTKRYVASCPIADYVNPAWRVPSEQLVPDLVKPIKVDPTTHEAVMDQKDVNNLFEALAKCEQYRGNLLMLIDAVKKK